MIGPRTSGGHIVAIVKLGFSFSRNSHDAFSANVLEARYPFEGFSRACSCVMGFQSFSEYVCSGQLPLKESMIEAKEDVIT